jgi:cobalt/nickel transport system permease protein
VVVLSAVLIVQCLMFADGGISALGANILNMGVIGGAGGWAIYYAVSRAVKGLFGCVLAAAVAAWCSTELAAIACAGELAASHTVPLAVSLPTMAGVHMLIGIGEGLITALVLAAVGRARPELLEAETATGAQGSYGAVIVYGALVAFGLALFVSPFASKWPDGLDKTAEALGFKTREARPIVSAPVTDYQMPGIGWSALATSLAGGAGTIVVFGSSWLLARVLVPRREAASVADPPASS